MMKTASLPLPVEWLPTKYGQGWMDLYHFRTSAFAGLPPSAQAKIIRVILHRLRQFNVLFHLWVELDAPGTWFAYELCLLVSDDTMVLTQLGKFPTLNDYAHLPALFVEHPSHLGPPSPTLQSPEKISLEPSVLRTLRILVRLNEAHTVEIASLAGYSKTHIRSRLKILQNKKLARRTKVGKHQGWAITRRGVRLAHRSWKLPPRVSFKRYREENHYAGARHRRVSCRWREWMEKAWPQAEVWDCWTELSLSRGHPDALAWGTWKGQETLFWVEVETGHKSREKLGWQFAQRLNAASRHAWQAKLPLVFVVLSLRQAQYKRQASPYGDVEHISKKCYLK
ncbi:MAG: hypothetical protein U9Q82_04600 [Chloroflexota bacterium]|nr:hypothetical protein [Chloroflexota bacterium]